MFTANPIYGFVIAALATWRVSHLIAKEEGPFHIFAKWRAKVGNHSIGELFTCFQCLSLWTGGALAIVVATTWPEMVLLTLALSGTACLLNRLGSEPFVIQPLPSRNLDLQEDHYHELLRQSHTDDGGDYDPIYELDALRRHPR